MNEPTLKDCLYCGHAAVAFHSPGGKSHWIECYSCIMQTAHCDSIEQAAEAWNTRPGDLPIIKEFYRRVCERAESNMLKTGKLEGAHFAAMKAAIEEMEKE